MPMLLHRFSQSIPCLLLWQGPSGGWHLRVQLECEQTGMCTPSDMGVDGTWSPEIVWTGGKGWTLRSVRRHDPEYFHSNTQICFPSSPLLLPKVVALYGSHQWGPWLWFCLDFCQWEPCQEIRVWGEGHMDGGHLFSPTSPGLRLRMAEPRKQRQALSWFDETPLSIGPFACGSGNLSPLLPLGFWIGRSMLLWMLAVFSVVPP